MHERNHTDVGSYYDQELVEMAEATGAEVLGLSVSEKQLQNLRRISIEVASPYTKAIKANMQKLPFKEGSADCIYSINAVYHVDSPEAVIRESHRVLKKGGRLGIDDWFITDITDVSQHEKLRHNWSMTKCSRMQH